MKKIMLSVSFFLIMQAIALSEGNPHDSLIFDPSGNPAPKKCNAKVYKVEGTVIGAVLTKRTEELCGEIDTIYDVKRQQLKEGDELEYNQLVETKGDGKVKLELQDGTVIMFDKNTKAVMTNDFCTDFSMKLIMGRMWSKVKSLLGGAKYEVTTERGFGGVRGTEFTYQINIDGNDTTDVIKLYEGSMEVRLTAPEIAADKKAEIEQAAKDLQNGKITMQEFGQKMKEFQSANKDFQELSKPVTVTEGNRCTATNTSIKIEPIEPGDDHWWEHLK